MIISLKSTLNNERRIWENTNNIVLWSRCALTVLEVWVDTSQHLRRWWSSLSSTQRSLKSSRYSPPGKWCVFEQVNWLDWFRGGQWCVADIHAQVCFKCWLNPKLIPPLLVFVMVPFVFRGCLFYGPPGTGKTLVARALANECSQGERRVSFFMRKGADCLSKWVGESERQLRLLFDQVNQTITQGTT